MLLLSACAGEREHRSGLNLLAEGKTEDGLSNLESAVAQAPDNSQYRLDLLSRRAEQVGRLLASAEVERGAGRFDEAQALYERVLKIEKANSRASHGIELLARERLHGPLIAEARESFKRGDLDRALGLLRPVLSESPSDVEAQALKRQIESKQTQDRTVEPLLQMGQRKPINLEFRDASVRMVFEALARTSGVNFILDKDVRPDLRTTVFLRQATLEDAIEFILQTSRLEKKVLNSSTILIYPNTTEKLKDYQELVVKGFYLANADAKQTQAMLKALLKSKDTFIDEKLNLLVMRDTPDAVRLAEKLIAMHDLYEPEVMLEVEVLEIKRSRLLEMGIQWPSQLVLAPIGSIGGTTLSDLKGLNADRITASIGPTTVNLRRAVGDANILANPRIRARNREKAKIMIGDKVPVSTSTTTATGVISESVQYLDVGIKLDVEPTIYLGDEVAIKIGLEVSSISNEVRTPGGSLAYQIGSRSASTVLRLKDGETQVLAGLINDEDRMAANRVPGVGDIPVLGRLFSSQKDDRNKTEIVLSITPRLVRNINRPDAAASEFWSGTESALRTRPLTMQVANEKQGLDPAAPGAGQGVMARGASPMAGQEEGPGAPRKDIEPVAVSLQLQAPEQVKAGQQFKLAVRIKSDGDLRNLPLQIAYDTTAFQVVGVEEGGFFKQNGGQSTLSSNVDATTGRIFASVLRSGTAGARGEDVAAVITLKALKANPKAEVRILSSTPITVNNRTIEPVMPAPLAIKVVDGK
ncbi:type IV pilus secretin PilQ [Janthinobacterium sp. SUN118]|uniref:type IV pilus secretin PilQ n=1 Tax=Janthinobacterium sp. SUN118 TaxID=3004100 RepID=UPI0025B212CB|nr:type IV pilus secretin PilQ [Janthinobacterium sp. SUN118]MDN2709882.1 type IV pilus secretin PilQ [Janthinobacterium sp. SUN118]